MQSDKKSWTIGNLKNFQFWLKDSRKKDPLEPFDDLRFVVNHNYIIHIKIMAPERLRQVPQTKAHFAHYLSINKSTELN